MILPPAQTPEYHESSVHRPFVYVLAASAPGVSNVVEAVESCLRDMERRLAEAGCDVTDVVNVRGYLPSSAMTIAGYAEYNQVYNRFFHAHGVLQKPARATVGIDPLRGLEVRMEVFALADLGATAEDR